VTVRACAAQRWQSPQTRHSLIARLVGCPVLASRAAVLMPPTATHQRVDARISATVMPDVAAARARPAGLPLRLRDTHCTAPQLSLSFCCCTAPAAQMGRRPLASRPLAHWRARIVCYFAGLVVPPPLPALGYLA